MPRVGPRFVGLVGLAVLIGGLLVVGWLATRSPSAERFAFYRMGRAALTIDGVPSSALPLITEGAAFISPHGAALTWQSRDGWSLNLNGPFDLDPRAPTLEPSDPSGAEPSNEPAANGSLQYDGADPSRWAGLDAHACAIVYSEVSTTRIAGSIHCRDLVWYDTSSVEHVRPIGTPPFDLDVAFEATGDGTLPTTSPS